MPFIDMTVFFIGGCFGGALVWHFKSFFQTFWRGVPGAIAALEAEAAKITAKVNAIKGAVKS